MIYLTFFGDFREDYDIETLEDIESCLNEYMDTYKLRKLILLHNEIIDRISRTEEITNEKMQYATEFHDSYENLVSKVNSSSFLGGRYIYTVDQVQDIIDDAYQSLEHIYLALRQYKV